ncbi:hypothetical protein [Paenarthrobacter sp.]|uniref:hypothetical protein n=1 Tax=Paenarthrobacter sp. TaxID=1931993 RepID=UPI0028120720|nr:hypothetical protein [Paenarthrobacter sp.]
MTSPGPRPFPVAGPAHPLDYWLSPELARISPSGAPSRLRQLADAQGTLAAAWSSAISGGILMVVAGVFFAAITGNLTVFLTLAPLGAALTVSGVFSWNRVRASLPDTNRLLISRGPGSVRSALWTVVLMAAVQGGIVATVMPGAVARGATTVITLAGCYVLLVALLVVCILIPSAVISRARQSFRQRVQENPIFRKAVEDDLVTWRDPYGNAGYGPL